MDLDILLCDLDAFFASVEQRDNPALRGRPVLVGGNPASRGVVSACSYEARRFGIRSAMPMKRAVELCPEALVLPVNIARYQEASDQVMEIFNRFTPDIEQVSIDEAYLAFKKGAGIKAGHLIRSAVRSELDLPLSIGVSANKLLAKIACGLAKPDNLKALWPGEIEKVLWPLPVSVLPGVGPVTEQKLAIFGVKTVGQIALFPLGALKNIVGKFAVDLKEYALGRDKSRLEPKGDPKSISEETTFAQDVYEQELIHAVLFDFASELAYKLRSAGYKARTVTVKIKFPDLSIKSSSHTLPAPADREEKIFAVAVDLFTRHCGKAPWRLVGLRVSGLEKGSQLSLVYSEAEAKKEQITQVLDTLRGKYGKDAVFKGKRLVPIKKKELFPE